MTDIDQLSRAVKDLEYRVRALEKANQETWNKGKFRRLAELATGYCACGRDICRAPDCPSHKTDPLGR